MGCDFAGIVTELGPKSDAMGLKIGDRIAGGVHGG